MRVIISLSDKKLCYHLLLFYKSHFNNFVDTKLVPQLIYIDCRDSFPISTFQSLILKEIPPIHVSSKEIFDNTRIILTLDLLELRDSLRKLFQTIFSDRGSKNHSKTLIFISGMEVMYRSTVFQGTIPTHQYLHEVLLLLRMLSNDSSNSVSVDLVLPQKEFNHYCPATELAAKPDTSAYHTAKRFKTNWHGRTNLLGDYITKFFTTTRDLIQCD